MSLRLTGQQRSQIERHGEATFPEECGGLLLGALQGDERVIQEVLPLDNVRRDSRHNRVELSPLDYIRAEREAEARGLGVWGFYHSHPDHPAIPSDFDLEHAAFCDWSYLIVSIRAGKAAELRSWTLLEDRSRFEEEPITAC